MEDLGKMMAELTANIARAIGQLNLDAKAKQLADLEVETARPDFWSNQAAASKTSQTASDLTKQIETWQSLESEAKDLLELAQSGDAKLAKELGQQYEALKQRFEAMEFELKLAGPYDSANAYLAIHAGTGGTDAMDWAAMLMRMYLRWGEAHGFKARVIDQTAGDEAGIKSALLEVGGHLAYGRLKSEHGVHRLVRKSPFNADHLRQTSFALVEVWPQIDQSEQVAIDPKDLRIDVFRSGGHGGQSVNTTDSAVRITHLPTNLVVSVQNERSQLQNRATAMIILTSRLAKLLADQKRATIAELKGPNVKAEWGQQIRNYVLDPYKLVKDVRTNTETTEVEKVLNGEIDQFIEAYLASQIS